MAIRAKAILLTLVASASITYYYLALFVPRLNHAHIPVHLAGGYEFGRDFYPIWLTARGTSDPYSPEMTREIQRGLFGRSFDSASDPPADYRTFAYPAFTDLVFWPLSWLSFPVARAVVAVLLAALTAISALLWARMVSWRPHPVVIGTVALLAICNYPVLEGLYACQLGLFVGFLISAGLYALQRGWLLLSATLLALGMIKPQMTIFVACYLILWSIYRWRQRRRFCLGFLCANVALTGAALLVWPHWIRSWITALSAYHNYAAGPLVAKILGIGDSFSVGAVAWVIALALSWSGRKEDLSSFNFSLTLSLLLCLTSVSLLPSQGFQDQIILLPAIFLIFSRWNEFSSSRSLTALRVLSLATLAWPWLAAFGIVAMYLFLSPQSIRSNAVFLLPVRTAAVFPFTLLGVLALTLRMRAARSTHVN
jgi:hypothetical protein